MFHTNEILKFLSIFQMEGFVFSVVHPPIERDGYWTPAHDELSKTASDFIRVLYKSGAVSPQFMDKTVVSDDRSYQLRNSNEALASASLFEVAHVLTFLTRAERFTPGTITTAYDSGLITRTLKRLSVISKSQE